MDGFPLGATIFPATGDGVLIVNSATAVPQTFYRPFAEFLAGQGVTVVTYDYRGIGRSRPPGRLPGVQASMRGWALLDVAGVLEWAAEQFPGRRLMALGHSFGGQVLGLLPNRHRITRTVLVASQLGYWRAIAPRDRPAAWFAMHVMVPGLSHALGYFPGSKVGLGEDLPKGVALEWARWCRSPLYLFDHLSPEERKRYDSFTVPMLAFKFTDDSFASGDSVEQLMGFYRKARPVLRTVAPGHVGVKRLGHFGFFRPQAGAALWPEVVHWVQPSAAYAGAAAGAD
jgi:predicted alpha/beta hydrolase